jgi:protein-S-isoprenylcysteine O-methyltransferase Ste14
MNDLHDPEKPPFAARPVSVKETTPGSQSSVGPILRFWLWLPDWAFQAIGVLFFLGYVYGYGIISDYRAWPNIGPTYYPVLFVDEHGAAHYGLPQYVPWAKLLIDGTFLLVILAFIFRVPPRRRADRPSQIVIPLIAAIWPLLPFLLLALLKAIHSPLHGQVVATLASGNLSPERFWLAVCLMSIGNGMDVWGYSTLFRSLSIVAEARVLKQRGAYRWIRHPIYLGQFLAQAGFYLLLVHLQVKWIIFYLIYVAMQLYRSGVEERVLIEAFGEEYQRYRRKAWWFF